MPIYKPQSKNIFTLSIVVGLALIGSILNVILDHANATPFSGVAPTNPYLAALYPIVFAGVPILLVSGFIFGIFTLGREENWLGRLQAIILLVFILVLAYLFSLLTFARGGF
ncbi:MAG TPA: hypothetical protein VLE93_02135 [Candidatus Saccharimonadales bacterium]|nr:hypothetical protein [Candidatus Saccharimonadales bacterium]